MNINRMINFSIALILIFSSAACTQIQSPNNTNAPIELVPSVEITSPEMQSTKPVIELPINVSEQRISSELPPEEFMDLANDLNGFAVELLQELNRENEQNLFFSPYSISLALAMAYAGANGITASEMAQVLHFNLPIEEFHSQLNSLDQSLYMVPEYLKDNKDSFQLNIANTLWGQSGYPFRQSYLNRLAKSYGAGLQEVDFINDSEQTRSQINDWVSEETEGKIEDLIPEGGLNSLTRLVITNAIYFNAAWMQPFEKKNTKTDDFYLSDGNAIKTPMMEIEERFSYQRDSDLQLVEIPYLNNRYSMVLVMPNESGLSGFIENLSSEQLSSRLESTRSGKVILRMPKFKFESSFSVNQALRELGMETAFSPIEADFTAMYEPAGDPLYISEVIHKAFVDVDEEGTEAAAATAVVMGATVAEPIDEPVLLAFNHPFMFLIRDRSSGLILFTGLIMNPGK